jgi:hypothetical protein
VLAIGSLAAWVFLPKLNETARPWKHTLEDLYVSDFPDLLNLERKTEATISDAARGLAPTTIHIRFRLYSDFRSIPILCLYSFRSAMTFGLTIVFIK